MACRQCFSKNMENRQQILELLTHGGNHRNKRQKPPSRSNFYPKKHAFLRFLKQETKEAKYEIRERRMIRVLLVTMDEMDLK